jgi:hypothetical protein
MEQLKIKILFLAIWTSLSVMAQSNEPVRIFYDTRIINGHSVELSNEGALKFIISHRFGRVNSGPYEFFGLDNSTARIAFDYGLGKNLSIGIGRNSFQKTFDGFVKYRLLQQGKRGKKISMVFLAGNTLKSLKLIEPNEDYRFAHRLSYNVSILLARRITDRLSLQVAPTYIHRNLVATIAESNDVFLLHTAGRFLLKKNLSLNLEYSYALPNQLAESNRNCLSIGFDIDTKGHVFQLQLSNSTGMVENLFMTQTTGKWTKGDIHYGFNITRNFKLKGKK